MKPRYKALRRIRTLLQFLAAFIFIGSILVGLFLVAASTLSFDANLNVISVPPNWLLLFPPVISGGLLAVIFVYIAQVTEVLIDIEANTRITADYFRRRSK